MGENSQAVIYNDQLYLEAFSSESITSYEEDLITTFGNWFHLSYSESTPDTNYSSVTISATINTTSKYPESSFKKNDFAQFSKKTQQKTKTSGKKNVYGFYQSDSVEIYFSNEKDSSVFLRILHDISWLS